MFNAIVYRVMVGSLSGAMEEVYAAKETIRTWNLENAKRTGKLFLPVEWTSKYEDIKDVDVVVGIVGNWIKNSSFIDDCIQSGKEVMLFFNVFQDPKNTIPSEQIEVGAFQKKLKSVCLCEDFNSIGELDSLLKKHLNIFAEA